MPSVRCSNTHCCAPGTVLTSDDCDVLVIGAGIHGAGVAQAAAARGYRVMVLEQTAPASGTSSRSSKLIHGGLRYLESAQFGLVRECLHERRVLLRIAPELVRLRPFHIPVYHNTRRRSWQIGLGLSLYAALDGFTTDSRFSRIARHDWAQLDGLDTTGLQDVFRYYDAQTDDAALTRAVLHSAQVLGALLRMPARVTRVERHAQGARVYYQCGDEERECNTRVLVNAAGPWVNEVLQKMVPTPVGMPVELVQGTHIVLPGSLTQGMYYLEAPTDARAVFAMPWQDAVLVGTTETPYHGAPEAVAPLSTELDYLLATCAHYFPAYRGLTREDIRSSYAGLRVLPMRPGAAFGRPRETLFHTDDPQRPTLLTIYGGKLTAYRATAQKVMQRLASSLPEPHLRVDTATLHLDV